jgi:hypothetical protein
MEYHKTGKKDRKYVYKLAMNILSPGELRPPDQRRKKKTG